jgi:hypothetical protein
MLIIHCYFFESTDMTSSTPETNANSNSKHITTEDGHAVPQLANTEDHDDSSDSMEESAVAAAPREKAALTKKIEPRRSVCWILSYTLRTLLLDVPLFIIVATFFACLWTHHVYDSYLEPQLRALLWTEDRSGEEITYYFRECDATDMTTHNRADLFLPKDATSEEAYEHQLYHGFTIFPRPPITCAIM